MQDLMLKSLFISITTISNLLVLLFISIKCIIGILILTKEYDYNSLVRHWNMVLAVTLLTTIATFHNPAFAQSTAPLVQQNDLIYQGAFRVQQGTTDRNTFGYGGTALTFNSAKNSLFMIGHDWYQYSAEIQIPSIINTTSISNLERAIILQAFRDPTEGKLGSINPSDPNGKKVGGQLVYNSKLYVTGYSYYDGAGTQIKSHFVRPINLSTSGQVQGPYTVGNQYPGFVSGYMTLIPSEWQSQFGGPALTGNCCLSIIGIQSNGPAASVFNPSDVGTRDPVAATPVVGYPSDHPLEGWSWNETNPIWNASTQIRGIVFPVGTRSVMFWGRHGVGTFCYGSGAECNDPADNSKGVHAYPYKYQVWAYDANDLVAVKNGTMQQWEVTPYSIWNFSLPFERSTDSHSIGGTAYDPQTNNIYVSQQCVDTDCVPIIHVFKVANAGSTTPLAAPTDLRVD